MSSKSEDKQATEASILSSLYIQALRQGQSVWFRVVSGSMRPLVQVGDAVRIEAATANTIQVGDIAAFETPAGLVVHRIVHLLRAATHTRLIEMGDIAFQANYVEERAIVGRVIAIRRANRQVDLQKPVAKWWGRVTAHLRYRLYCLHKDTQPSPVRILLRKCARLAVRTASLCVRASSASAANDSLPSVEGI